MEMLRKKILGGLNMVKEENKQVKINESNLQVVIENLKKNKYIDRKKRLKTIFITGKLYTIVGEYQDKNRKFILIVHENSNKEGLPAPGTSRCRRHGHERNPDRDAPHCSKPPRFVHLYLPIPM